MSFAKSRKLQPEGTDPSTWSVEHILPQSTAGTNVSDPGYSIGNLTLLPSALNNDLGNADLSEKGPALRAGSAYLDPELDSWLNLDLKNPSAEQIVKRTKRLSDEAFAEVWKI
jgi:hypothetical protein